jgi:fructokinase
VILAAGEAIVDLVPAALAEGGTGFRVVPGGAALNLARAVAALGARAGLCCPLSTDPWGVMLREAARAAGVDVTLCPVVARPTTLAVVTLADGLPAYAFHDEGSAMRGLTLADLPALPAGVQALVVGGISLVPEPCGTAFAAFAAAAAGRAVVAVDANVRPAFLRDGAALRARLRGLFGGADVVKLSDEDAAWLYGPGGPGDWAAAALADGAGLVLLTRGAAGALAATPAAQAGRAAPAVAVADTVGAGDAFLAAALDGFARRGALRPGGPAALPRDLLAAVLAEAVAAGSLACTRPGAQPPARAAVLALAAQSA